MGAYLVRRLGFVLLVLLGVTILTFFLARVVPSDPARLLAGGFDFRHAAIEPALRAALR